MGRINLDLPIAGYPFVPPAQGFGPYIDNSGSTRIEFDDIDLRPGGRVGLDPIHLVSDSTLAGTTLTAIWTVTSTSTDGVARGEFPITVLSEVVEPLNK